MLREGLMGFGILIGYYIIAVSLVLLLKARLKPLHELRRKILHIICVMSVFVYMNAFDTWYMAVCTAFGFAFVLYPVLTFAERFPLIMKILNERQTGEVKRSLIIVQVMIALLIAIFWGWMGDAWKYIVIVAVLAWGFGDAAAALVGKAWGRRKIKHPWVDGKKTIEGTLAMYIVSGILLLTTLTLYAGTPWYLGFLAALIVAPVCAGVELISHHGLDTITVPISTAVLTCAVMYLFSMTGV